MAPREAGLDEIPVTEEHGVGDSAEECSADEHTQERHRQHADTLTRWDSIDAGRHQTGNGESHREKVEHGRELPAHAR